MYGVTGEVTEEVKTATESLQKNSQISTWIHISGGGERTPEVKKLEATSGEESPLLSIKKQADDFYQELKDGKHKYRRLSVFPPVTSQQFAFFLASTGY